VVGEEQSAAKYNASVVRRISSTTSAVHVTGVSGEEVVGSKGGVMKGANNTNSEREMILGRRVSKPSGGFGKGRRRSRM